MDLIFSIAIALYTTIKTTTTIIELVKTRKERDVLQRELKVINLMDMVVSILTMQNTLIAVNSVGGDTTGIQTPFTVYKAGNRVKGTWDLNTKKFTVSGEEGSLS